MHFITNQIKTGIAAKHSHSVKSVKLYGIPNCDTVKKAMLWLKVNNIDFELHDFKQKGITEAKLAEWLTKQPLALLLNRKSTAWKALSPAEQAQAGDIEGATVLMQKYTNLVKRPVLEYADVLLVGFSEAIYVKHFKP